MRASSNADPRERSVRGALSGEPGAWLLCLVALGILATWLMWGSVISGGQRVPGAEDTEIWAFLWGGHWMAHALWVEGRYPFETLLLDFPRGGVLFLKDPVALLLAQPLQLLLGIPAAHALRVWALLVGAGFGCFLLARSLGLGRWVAILAGATFTCCPHLLGEVYNGNTEAAAGLWSPLWLWAMVRLVQRPSLGRAAVGGLLLAVLLSSNQYYALVMALVSGPVLLAALLRERQAPLGRVLLALSGALVLGALLFSPMAWGLFVSMDAPNQLTFLDERIPLEPPWITDLAHLVRPLAILREGVFRVPLQDIVYPGFLLVALSLAAPLLGPRGPWRWLWPALGLSLLALSLGPVLVVDTELVRWISGAPVFLPWAYLIAGKPILGSMTLPHRMALPAGLFLSLGAAWSVQGLVARARRRAGARGLVLAGLAAALLAGAVVEQLAYPPYRVPLATVSLEEPAHVGPLAAVPGEGAVLDLPFIEGASRRRVYLWWQALHGRPIAASLRFGGEPSVVAQVPWLKALFAFQARRSAVPEGDPDAASQLRGAGYAFVVLHLRYLDQRGDPHEEEDAWRGALEATLGEGIPCGDDHLVYPLDPALASALGAALSEGS